MLAHVRDVAAGLDCPIRVVRQDLVERCGPLGGVYTGLKQSRPGSVLFLACDMPFVGLPLLRRLWARHRSRGRAVFATQGRRAGFPFILSTECIEVVVSHLERRLHSLSDLAKGLEAIRLSVKSRMELENINTPEDLARLSQGVHGKGSDTNGQR